ncbi:unnamed protein product [Calicophoron daubneyi]|uniref:Exonuclease domain-containing protein n=1 Tax=Calicophoron daubneyi TaxID=300641 RepID=A0AAV2T6B9_CALDB
MVDNQPYLKDVLQLFDEFMQTEKLGTEDNSFAFVTCGDWDLRKMLPSQCKLLEIDVPTYFRKWINIKKVHADVVGRFPSGMLQMLSDLDLPHQGRHHSGIGSFFYRLFDVYGYASFGPNEQAHLSSAYSLVTVCACVGLFLCS